MSVPTELGPGVTVEVQPPQVPTLVMAAPASTSVEVLPVAGPAGPQGEPGISGDARALEYLHTQGAPASLWQIDHQLGFRPAGIVIVDTATPPGLLECDRITWPSENVVELHFGTPTQPVPAAGSAYLS